MNDNTTPRPWKIELEHQGIRGRKENITIVTAHNVVARAGDTAMPGALEDANLIVRAVNSFDALVAACKAAATLIAHLEDEWEHTTPEGQQLRAALAKAAPDQANREAARIAARLREGEESQ